MAVEKEVKRSSSGWKIGLIIGIVLVVVFGGYLGLAWILRTADSGATDISNGSPVSSSKLTDKSLIGTWESDCLVPDPGSKWAEKHKYIINANGTAIHTRQDWEMADCTSVQPTGLITDTFKIIIPSAGKINSTYTAAENTRMDAAQLSSLTGNTLYDIYQVSGNTLKFGWGFRDDLSYGSQKAGISESDRIDSLNEYIIYKKQ